MRKPIPGYEDLYEINTSGRVYHKDRPVTALSTSVSNSGYKQVNLWKNNKSTMLYIHRLLACCFIPPIADKEHVNHKDGIKLNNTLDNLEWSDRSYNAQHTIATGLKVYTNRLTRNEFLEVLNAVISGKSYSEMCKVVPYKVPFLSTKIRKIAEEEGLVEKLNASLAEQRKNRAIKNLEAINA